MLNKTIIYYASGDRYVKESIFSINTLRTYHPNIPIIIYTDNISKYKNKFHHMSLYPIVKKLNRKSYRAKIPAMYESINDANKLLFLDTDTIILDNISGIFNLLDKFDIMAARAPVRFPNSSPRARQFKEAPEPYTQFNTGVVAFKSSANTQKLFAAWWEYYRKTEEKADQPTFRRAMYESNLLTYVLPEEYNLRAGFYQVISEKIRIVHSRRLFNYSKPQFDKVIKRLKSYKPDKPQFWDPKYLNIT